MEGEEVKQQERPKLKVVKVQVLPTYHLMDGDTVLEEVTASPITMYPGKFLSFGEMVKRLEADANKDEKGVDALLNRPLW